MTVVIYTNNATESEKVAEKLNAYGIENKIKHIVRDGFAEIEFKTLLSMTDNGLDDLLTQRGNGIDLLKKEHGIDLDDLTLKQVYQLVLEYPKILKTTIITDWNKIAYGQNGVDTFLPRNMRIANHQKILRDIGTNQVHDPTYITEEGEDEDE
jgi:regulatory protein spx